MFIKPSRNRTNKNNINRPLKEPTSRKQRILYSVQIICILIMIVCTYYLLQELLIKRYHSNQVIKMTQSLYQPNTQSVNTPNANFNTPSKENNNKTAYETSQYLTKFTELVELNPDVKGWIHIDGTNIDYPVLQSNKIDPEFYLTRNINKEEDKCGSIFLDVNTNIETPSQSLVLHGHNMTSTSNMFHELIGYNKLEFYQDHPIIQFDSIYEESTWKVFSIFRTNGSSEKEPLFQYQRGAFMDKSDFLNFVYQLRLRSIIDIPVDIKDDDRLLLLSTCSYELNNYRTVIVARKVRENETLDVDVNLATPNKTPLYPQSWYKQFGGTAPIQSTFEQALSSQQINWYSN